MTCSRWWVVLWIKKIIYLGQLWVRLKDWNPMQLTIPLLMMTKTMQSPLMQWFSLLPDVGWHSKERERDESERVTRDTQDSSWSGLVRKSNLVYIHVSLKSWKMAMRAKHKSSQGSLWEEEKSREKHQPILLFLKEATSMSACKSASWTLLFHRNHCGERILQSDDRKRRWSTRRSYRTKK